MIDIDRPSHRAALLAGLALLVGVNAIALGGVAWNRGAEDARLVLTQRELRLPYSWARTDGEDPGLTLQLDWRNETACLPDKACENYDYGDTAWLDAQKLAALGFDVSPRPRPVDTDRDPRAQEREVVLVLEVAGPAFHRYLRQREADLRRAQEAVKHAGQPGDPVAEAARAARGEAEAAAASVQAARNEVTTRAEQLRQAVEEDSRLFAVDAGLDREALRRKYPDRHRYALVPALAGFTPRWEGDKYVAQGRVGRLLGEGISVPRRLTGELGVANGLAIAPQSPARFEVVLAFGRRLEPWVISTRSVDAAPVSPAASQ
jgi:hypothetical protein